MASDYRVTVQVGYCVELQSLSRYAPMTAVLHNTPLDHNRRLFRATHFAKILKILEKF